MTLQVVGWGVLAFVGLLVGYLAVVIFSPWIKEPRQPLPDVPRLTAGDGEAQVAAVPEAVQQEVRFTVAGEQLLGWLYMPPGATGPVPCVVMNTGFGGTRGAGSALTPFVSRFAQAGLAALTFDYRHFGASGGEPRHLFSLDKQVADCRGAIAHVRGLPEIDARRIAVWGTSAGGGYGFVIAAEDEDIACVCAQCTGLDHHAEGKLVFKREGLGFILRLFVHAQRDMGRSRFGLSPHRIPMVGRPGATAVLTAPGTLEEYARIAGPDFPNEVCARVMVTRHGKTAGDVIDQVRCPALVQICQHDILVSTAGTLAVAKRMGSLAEITQYPIGHFDIYRGEHFERAVSDQIAFFRRHLTG